MEARCVGSLGVPPGHAIVRSSDGWIHSHCRRESRTQPCGGRSCITRHTVAGIHATRSCARGATYLLRGPFCFGLLLTAPDRLAVARRERVVFAFFRVVFRFFGVVLRFLRAAGLFFTRSGSVVPPVSWFHSS